MTRVASADSEVAGGSKGTVARAVAVLRVVAHSAEPVSVTELATELGLAASTTHRLLHLLCDEGMSLSLRCHLQLKRKKPSLSESQIIRRRNQSCKPKKTERNTCDILKMSGF